MVNKNKNKTNAWKKKLLAMPVFERKKFMEYSVNELKRLDNYASNSHKIKGDNNSIQIMKSNSYFNNKAKNNVTNSIILNGIKMKLQNPDLDGDGQIGGEEKIEKNFNKSLVQIKEGSELGDAIKEQNKDIVADRLSSMDFASRIDKLEMSPMIALDTLIGMGVIPIECGKLNRVKMRKSVSIGGEGRKEFVDLVIGKKEQDMKLGMGQKLGNFIGMGQKPEGQM